MVRYTFTKDERLRTARDFQRVRRTGRSFGSHGIFLNIACSSENTLPRLGLVIGKKYGNAVHRNRMKRLIREIFRLHKHELRRGCDIVAGASASATELSYHELERIFLDIATKSGIIA